MKKTVVFFLLGSIFIFSGAFATHRYQSLTIKTIDWGKEPAPERILLTKSNDEKTCYNIIAFYTGASKSFSVRNKGDKWVAKYGVWDCGK